MSLVACPPDDSFYMPHHAVVKQSSNTTKVRIVFDASAKSKDNVLLNDLLMVGPTIQERLFSHLIRFRTYKYVITADIEKMYRQVLVHEDDRRYQMILWREHDEIKTYQLNTLTFGVSSSPFLAIRAMQQLADDDGHLFPKAAAVLKQHLYVDDLLSGANSVQEARNLRDEIIALLRRGGFAIRQWASNDARVIRDLPNNALHANYLLGDDHSLKTLGISWNTRNDKICYYAREIEISGILSKRKILSEIAKIYDPLGLLGPVILYAKQLMQDLWRSQVHWDESVPQNIYLKWSEFSQQFKAIDNISFDREIFISGRQGIQLHGFCDASCVGYGACIYVRSFDKNNKSVCKILCSKSRVAPLKAVTIPRLELCGALLLARLYREIRDTLNVIPSKVVFWCDSTIVLHWLNTAPHLLKTYVANRVIEIRELTETHAWRHVRSEDNPADSVSRGQLPHAFLKNDKWRVGPVWLIRDESEWPESTMPTVEVPELKRNICLTTSVADLSILEKYSSHFKLCRIVAYCLRVRLTNTYRGPLCPEEINAAEIRIIKLLQSSTFADEIKKLKNERSPYQGKLISLSPFLDNDGVLRVRGRLQSSNLPTPQKHPMLLPSRNRVSDRIIREVHEKHYHTSIQGTLYALRQKFWLLDGRNQVRKIIRACVRCHRFDSRVTEYKMGNLPESRVCETIPFTKTGIDFCSPFFVKERKHRNRVRIKAYVCVFVCMTIKAVHLELRVVGDLLFTFEELSTFTTEIEGILNSRPITSISSDPNDLPALTPAHYLIGKPITALPEGDLRSIPENRLSTWQHITKVRQDFWARWHFEYLNELQKRGKWHKDTRNLSVGAVVLVKERNLPCTHWALGRITQLYPGKDGITRAADLKTINGEVRRAVKTLCPLPVD
ncbi:uncharacterized protein LOC118646349 [Monomorium pharaonis]|uniref:uncharacterized protein LOC118646349 n=1 Tax=Monomorium pharaonis TaxID=307658 RepID=UPI0017473726|nr:uncharacterized protein LOC118646349 [Monomorium pharaonis]